MDEPKRIQLTTIDQPEKKDKKGLPNVTVRFNLDLTESTDTACPEFFYPDLLKPQSQGADEKPSSDDPFGDDEDASKLAAIAKAFEDKYNKPVDGKKKKKKKGNNEPDYMTILGDGYDENDTFIDNSEAYDEILPYEMTTKLGGFYINSGKLDFKELSEDSEEDFQPKSLKKNKKKRRISSDEDSGVEEKVVKKKKIRDTLCEEGEVKRKKKKKLQLDGEKPFKKPKQPQDRDKQKQNKSASVAALLKSTSPNLNGDSQENGLASPTEESGDSNESIEANSNLKSSVSEAIDAVISMSAMDTSSNQSDVIEEQKKDVDPESVPKLPPNLNAEIEAKLEELKKQAQVSRDGKCKFFTPTVNKLLLEVEMSSKGLTVSNRSAMYAHLAAFLPCSKETLLKRAKTLRVKELEDKIKEPLEKLRQVVNRMMPELLENYEAECKKHAQERAEEGSKASVEGEKESGKEEGNTEDSGDEEEKSQQPSDSAKKQRATMPRKKFSWSNNIRSLLNDVVRVKMHTFQMSKTRSQTAEEFCKAFLDQDVRPLWPKGWMQTRMLYKESKPAHGLWTNPQKQKKSMIVSKTPGSATTSAAQSVKVSSAVTAQSSMNGSKVPVVNVTKLTTVTKTTPVFMNSAKTAVNSAKAPENNVNTPSSGPKRIIPTLLDYADSGMMSKAGVKTTSPITSLPQSSAMNLSVNSSPKSQTSPKGPGSNPKETEKWGHIVSDILRSSMSDSQLKSTTTPSSSNQAGKSFHSQFESFTNNLITQGLATQKLKSPTQERIALQLEYQKKHQLKILQEKIALQEKHRMLLQQATGKPQPPINPHSHHVVKPQANQSSAKPVNQSKPPSQSPMSLAMAKSILAGQSGTKVMPKQLVNQFSKETAQGMSLLTENVIRHQLSGSKVPPSTVVVQAKPMNKGGTVVVSSQSGQVTSSTDSLRKASPQSQALHAAHISQVKSSVPKVVKVQTSQSPNAQNLVFHKPGGGNITITTDNKSATNLLKVLFSQAQSSVTKLPTPVDTASLQQQQQALIQATAGAVQGNQRPSQQQWSPTSSPKAGHQPARAVYQGSPDGSVSKPYIVPTTSARPVPGYQSVKLPTPTGEQLAAFPQAPLAHRSPESGLYGNQMISRPSPGPTSPHLTPEQHLYNALHYGYRGYQDSTK